MQDNRGNQFMENQPVHQQDTQTYANIPSSSTSFKRTRTQYEAQTIPRAYDNLAYSQTMKGGTAISIERNTEEEFESNQMPKAAVGIPQKDLYNQSNQETIYNIGKYGETPVNAKIIDQQFKAPNEPKSFRAPENYQQSNLNRSLTQARPSNQLMQDSIRQKTNNQKMQVSEFDVVEHSNYNSSGACSVFKNCPQWKKEYNQIGFVFGSVCIGGVIAYMSYEHFKDHQFNFHFQEHFDNVYPPPQEFVILCGVVVSIGIILIILQKKDKTETEQIAQEDYNELMALLSTNLKDSSFIGIFLDFFIQTRAEYWNIGKVKYEQKVIPLIKSKIQQGGKIEETEVMVSLQALKLWRLIQDDIEQYP